MKQWRLLLAGSCFAALAWTGSVARAQNDPALNEPGVLYLQGNVPEKVTVVVKAATTIYSQRNFQTALGAFYPGQTVEVVGSSPEGYILKGSFRNNTISGWVRPEDLPTGF